MHFLAIGYRLKAIGYRLQMGKFESLAKSWIRPAMGNFQLQVTCVPPGFGTCLQGAFAGFGKFGTRDLFSPPCLDVV